MKKYEKVKRHFGKLWEQVNKIFLKHDPMGIFFGKNIEEYYPEISTILPRLSRCMSAADVLEVVYLEFVHWFGESMAGPKSKYKEIADEIWKVYKKTSRTKNENTVESVRAP